MAPLYLVFRELEHDSGIGAYTSRDIISRHREPLEAIAAITLDSDLLIACELSPTLFIVMEGAKEVSGPYYNREGADYGLKHVRKPSGNETIKEI